MNRLICAGLATVLCAAAAASADNSLHLDVNGAAFQIHDGSGANSAFGGLGHTGSIVFSFAPGTTQLVGIDTQNGSNAPVNQNFSGSLTNFTGTINLVNGQVTGGNLSVQVNGSDSYSASITPNIGSVSMFVGGGFKVEGLTFNGMFSGPNFGNVDVSPWFNSQGPGGLLGSFLQFNFNPDASGAGFSDMDVFVRPQVIPVPPAAWTGIATLAGVMAAGYVRRRR